MATNFKTSPAGRAFIEGNEGLVLKLKYDAKGHYEIGYGHDVLPGEDFSNGIMQSEADLLLSGDLVEREAFLNQHMPDGSTQNQFDALMDYLYEEGAGDFLTMLAHGWDQIPVQLLRWEYVDGQPNAAVEARRQKDVALFNSQTGGNGG